MDIVLTGPAALAAILCPLVVATAFGWGIAEVKYRGWRYNKARRERYGRLIKRLRDTGGQNRTSAYLVTDEAADVLEEIVFRKPKKL